MIQRLQFVRTAAVLAFGLSAAGFAVAQGEQQATEVKKGGVLQQPVVVQPAPVATVGPVSRPGNWGSSLAPQGVISVLLTVAECKGIGGTVNDVPTKACESGKACMTAGSDGVIRSKCIDNKVN